MEVDFRPPLTSSSIEVVPTSIDVPQFGHIWRITMMLWHPDTNFKITSWPQRLAVAGHELPDPKSWHHIIQLHKRRQWNNNMGKWNSYTRCGECTSYIRKDNMKKHKTNACAKRKQLIDKGDAVIMPCGSFSRKTHINRHKKSCKMAPVEDGKQPCNYMNLLESQLTHSNKNIQSRGTKPREQPATCRPYVGMSHANKLKKKTSWNLNVPNKKLRKIFKVSITRLKRDNYMREMHDRRIQWPTDKSGHSNALNLLRK